MLPRQLPPTFHGSAVRFSYTVIITYRAEFAPLGSTANTTEPLSPHGIPSSPPAALDVTVDVEPEPGHSAELPPGQPHNHDAVVMAAQMQQAAVAAEVLQQHGAANGAVDAVDTGGHGGAVDASDVADTAAAVQVGQPAPWATRSGEV